MIHCLISNLIQPSHINSATLIIISFVALCVNLKDKYKQYEYSKGKYDRHLLNSIKSSPTHTKEYKIPSQEKYTLNSPYHDTNNTSLSRSMINDHRTHEAPKSLPKVDLCSFPFYTPSSRVHASFAIDERSGNLILYGGENSNSMISDMYEYQSEKHRWRKIEPTVFTSKNGERLAKSKCPMLVVNDILIGFGGSSYDEMGCKIKADSLLVAAKWGDCLEKSTDSLALDDSPLCDHHKYSCNNIDNSDATRCDWPTSRVDHAMCKYGRFVFLFGGKDMRNLLDDFWLLDTTKITNEKVKNLWRRINKSSSVKYWPNGRYGHCMAAINGIIFLLGGNFEENTNPPYLEGEVECFDMEAAYWKSEPTCGNHPNCHHITSMHEVHSAGKIITISSKELAPNCGLFNRCDVLDTTTRPFCWTTVDFKWHGDWTLIPFRRNQIVSAFDSTDCLLYVFGGECASSTSIINEPSGDDCSFFVANFSGFFKVLQ